MFRLISMIRESRRARPAKRPIVLNQPNLDLVVSEVNEKILTRTYPDDPTAGSSALTGAG